MDTVLYIAIYLLGAGLTAALIYEEGPGFTLWCSSFWPITLPVMIGFWLGKMMLKIL